MSMMQVNDKVISVSDEMPLSEFEMSGVFPCARCDAPMYDTDIVREVMTNDMKLYLVCKHCADEIVHGVKA